MARTKDKITFAVSYTGDHLQEGKDILKYLSKFKKREKGIGKTSPISTFLRNAIKDYINKAKNGSILTESSPEVLTPENIKAIDQFYPQFKTITERINQLVNDHIRYSKWLDKLHDELPTFKYFEAVKYPSKCIECNEVISEGSPAYGAKTEKGWMMLCIDCQLEKSELSDPHIAKLVIKEKKSKQKIKALKNEIDRLASKLEESYMLDKIYETFCKEAREGEYLDKNALRDAISWIQDKREREQLGKIKPIKSSRKEVSLQLTNSHAGSYQPSKDSTINSHPAIYCPDKDAMISPVFCGLCKIQDFLKWEACQEHKQSQSEQKNNSKGNYIRKDGGVQSRPVGYDPFREPFNG